VLLVLAAARRHPKLQLVALGVLRYSLYSIFILDLCFIMPAFLVLAVLA
jgi:hypothetical protein